jgi:hypothetical protein
VRLPVSVTLDVAVFVTEELDDAVRDCRRDEIAISAKQRIQVPGRIGNGAPA